MTIDSEILELKEKLAAIEHERWSDWQKWCHEIIREHNPSPEIEWVLKRWDRQIDTPYSELSDREKASDMEQVDRYWPLIEQLIEAKVREAEKAYGGCHKCYGKGYSTTWSGLAGNRDFDSPGFVTPPKNHMRFCTCDRGKQLQKQLQSNQEGDRDG